MHARDWMLSLLATTLVACAQGPAPTEAELGQDGEFGEQPEIPAPPLEAPEAAKPPQRGEAPGPAPAPPPPRNAEPGCPGIDEHGSCRGARAIWCEAGRVRSLECGAIGLTCDWVDQETGFYCVDPNREQAPPPPNEGAPPPNEGAPPPNEGAPPPVPEEEEGNPPPPVPEEEEEEDEPDGPAAPPPPAPEEEEPADPVPPPGAPPPPEEEGAPEPDDGPEGAPPPEEDPCQGIDYLGACEEDVAVWCDVDRLRRADCGANGQVCGWINDRTGYYCKDSDEETEPEPEEAPPPPEEEAPPPEDGPDEAPPPEEEAPPEEENPAPPIGEEDGCGDVTWQGHCEGDVVVYCDGAGVVRHDCGPGATCGWVSDEIGNFCVAR